MRTEAVVFAVWTLGACGSADEATKSETFDLTSSQCSYFADGNKVTVCHRTSSAKNPYQSISLSLTSCAAHVAHDGDYIAYNDPSCNGQGCFPEGAPYDGSVECCDGLHPENGVCTADTHHCSPGDVDLFVSDFNGRRVLRFDAATNALIGELSTPQTLPRGVAVLGSHLYVADGGDLTGEWGLRRYNACFFNNEGLIQGPDTVGPLGLKVIDGNLYGGDNYYNRIVTLSGTQLVRFAGPLGPTVLGTEDGVPVRDRSNSIALAGGYALVAGGFTSGIYRQDRTTGLYHSTLASNVSASDLVLGTDGNLYVATSAGVVRYAQDGTSLGTFIPAGSGGLQAPVWLELFGNSLYVSDGSSIHTYDATTGAHQSLVVDGSGLGTSSLWYFTLVAH